MSQHNPVAVISGGSAGIGLATAIELARQGYDIALLARDRARVERAADDLRRHGVKTLGLSCDVGDASAVDAACATILDTFGTFEVWVNCAMATVFGPFDTLDDKEFRAVMDTTFMGQVNGTRAALSVMKPNGHGAIVNVGSGLSYRSVPLQSAYCAAKHAINGFTSSVRSELIHDGFDNISISLVQLPAVNTPQFDWARSKLDRVPRPAAPVFQPEVAARGIVQAIDTGAREIIVGRSALQLMFGQMVVPNYLDHKLADAGWDGQHSEEPDPGKTKGNLMEPVSGNQGAHGSYDDEAADSGMTVDADMMRGVIFAGGALLAVGLGALLGSRATKRLSNDDYPRIARD